MATLLLCSDESILLEGLARVLSEYEGLELCPSCLGMDQIREQMHLLQPELLLIDLNSQVTFQSLSALQETACRSRIVLWVHSIPTELALQAVSLGVRGILRKSLPVETLIQCLTHVQQGGLWFEKALTDSITTARRYSLTRREGQLISLLSHGLRNKEIATNLHISEGTVKVYLSRLFQKLGVKDRFELALYGLRNFSPGAAPEGTQLTGCADEVTSPTPRSFFVDRLPRQADVNLLAGIQR